MRQAMWRVGRYSKVVLTVMCLWFIASAYSSAQTPRDIAQKSFPSVVMLLMEDANSQPIALGSGFFVREDVVATNLHVIRNSERGYAKIVGKKPTYDITGIVGIDAETGKITDYSRKLRESMTEIPENKYVDRDPSFEDLDPEYWPLDEKYRTTILEDLKLEYWTHDESYLIFESMINSFEFFN